MRTLLSPNEDFSRNGIIRHNDKIANLAKLLLEHHVSVCVSKINPFVVNRENARKILKNYDFVEIYIKCPIDLCEKRDVKGMYKKARNDEIRNFIGVHIKYESPISPDLIVDTENSTINNNVQIILDYLKENKMI
jgi:adenylylsulfate kinase